MNTDFNTKSFEKLNDREILQNLFDLSFLKMDTGSLRNHYQALRKLELDSPLLDFIFENVDVSSLVENITIACDIICAENKINFIYCGNDTSHIDGNIKLITKSILCLLSNAFLYSQGGLVTVKTIEKGNFISIEIQNAGCLENDFIFDNGLKYVHNICNALNGYFFMCTDLLSVKAVMILPKSKNYKEIAPTPHFCEMLSDRLSPVYVEFFGIN